ncbi:MAG: NAD(P)/FAD-dependent oxidoreductase [bacterium]|nr:NAD(P)/FAD-dependent oxidoreductase [bacterium]
MTQTITKKVYILGGGFAGIRIAHLLSDAGKDLEINLIDRHPYHINAPILYEVANAFVPWEMEAVGRVLTDASTAPYDKIFDGTSVNFMQGIVSSIDPKTRQFYLADGRTETPDFMVISLGSQSQTSDAPGANNYAFTLRTLDDAVALRKHIVSLFLRYRTASLMAQQKAFTFVVAGGGPTGVEYAAELSLFIKKLCRLHRVDHEIPKIILCEETDYVLHTCPGILRQRGHARLRELGVQMRAHTKVTAVHQDSVEIADGVMFPTLTTIWLAGTRVNDVLLRSNFPMNTTGGLITDKNLLVSGSTNIFAAGDCTYFIDPITGKVAPDVAWAALQQAEIVAKNIIRHLDGQPLISYFSEHRPLLIAVGGKFALARLGPFQFSGFLAWVVKQLADLRYLWSILPNTMAVRYWLKSLRVKISND